MQDLAIGGLAVLVGALFCFQGFMTMRIVIPIWGAFTGFFLGAGLMQNLTDDRFLGSVGAWLVGLGVAILFGALAYLYFEVSVTVAMAAIGLPTFLLVVLTALAGASSIVFGLMLWTGVIDLGDIESAATTERLDDDWWWYAGYVVLAIAGIIVQFRRADQLSRSMREQWAEAGGRELSKS